VRYVSESCSREPGVPREGRHVARELVHVFLRPVRCRNRLLFDSVRPSRPGGIVDRRAEAY
jgi:hypothetical protein